MELQQSFTTFSKASDYAKRMARKLGTTLRIIHQENEWIVTTKQQPRTKEREKAWQRRIILRERQGRENLAQIRADTKAVRSAASAEHEKWQNMTDEELEEIWPLDGRWRQDNLTAEQKIVRRIIRKRLGIDKLKLTEHSTYQICERCGMRDTACVC